MKKRVIKGERLRINVDVAAEIAERFKALTRENGRSMSWVLQKYMEQYICETGK
jgi:predicted DNA-binding protein